VISSNLEVLSTPAAKADAAKAKTKVEARMLIDLCWLLVLDQKVSWVKKLGGWKVMRYAFE
jgi:hypothetical protein